MPETTLPASRLCSCCKQEKPAAEFSIQRRKNGSANLRSMCKACIRVSPRVRPKQPERLCDYCGVTFQPITVRGRTCSRECYFLARARDAGVQPRSTVADGSKVCRVCGERKPLEEFYSRKDGKGGGRTGRCKPCSQEVMRRHYHGGKGRNRRYLYEYGVTLEWYERTLQKQGGRCAICLCAQPSDGRPFDLDHCHATGTPRGLLCRDCNIGLGRFYDNPDALRRASEYLLTAERTQAA